MESIKRFYVNLNKDDDETQMIESELAGIKDSVQKTKKAVSETQKQILAKHS